MYYMQLIVIYYMVNYIMLVIDIKVFKGRKLSSFYGCISMEIEIYEMLNFFIIVYNVF